MKKYLVSLLMLSLLLAVFAACGSNDSNDSNDSGSGNDSGATVTAPGDDNDDGWVEPDLPDENDDGNDLEPTGTPTAGRPLVYNGVPFTRAQILSILEDAPAPSGQLVIGDNTIVQGNMIDGFSSEMTGTWVRELMHAGRATMVMDFAGQWIPNPMVLREPTRITNNADGTRTYTFSIYTDNLWSDGTPITAIDYVFSIMIYSSQAMANIGATTNSGLWIDGFFEFRHGRTYGTTTADWQLLDENGNVRTDVEFDEEEGIWVDSDGEPASGVVVDTFRGLRLYGPDSFSVTIRSQGIPFVWDFLYQNWAPAPFHYWNRSGQFTLEDTPEGARLTGFYADYLAELVNSANGIRYNPTVVAGPYLLRSFDEGSGTVILDRNPVFQGTWDGFMPQIQTIAIEQRPTATIMDSLRVGEIDMVHGQRGGTEINAGWAIVEDLGLHRGNDFPRHGYGYLGWHGDHGPGQFYNVRRSIAWLIDREDFARQFTLGFGTVQHGPYALRGWEFQEVGHDLYAHPDFTHFGFNPAQAVAELEAGGWVLNSAGEPFTPGVDEWRYKDVTGMTNWMGEPIDEGLENGLMRLEMIWAANDNRVSDIMRVVFPPEAAAVGMNIIEELYPAGTSNIPAWQRAPGSPYATGAERFRAHHIYTLAVGLPSPSQLWNSWSNLPEMVAPGFNTHFHGDDLLSDLSLAMREIDPAVDGWEERYLDLWLQFQLRYNEIMPLLPLYADDDHDFVPLWLGNWDANGIWDFRYAVKRAYDAR